MRYYRLLDDLDSERWFLGDFRFDNNETVWDFVGSGIKKKLTYTPKANIRHFGNYVDITFEDFDVLVVDEKAKKCFSHNEVQFFPIQIFGSKFKGNYSIMTIINELDCLDENFSKFDVYTADDEIRPDLAGQYKTIYKMIIDKNKVYRVDIFRIKGYNVAIVVSENIKQILEQRSIKGVKFKEV